MSEQPPKTAPAQSTQSSPQKPPPKRVSILIAGKVVWSSDDPEQPSSPEFRRRIHEALRPVAAKLPWPTKKGP